MRPVVNLLRLALLFLWSRFLVPDNDWLMNIGEGE